MKQDTAEQKDRAKTAATICAVSQTSLHREPSHCSLRHPFGSFGKVAVSSPGLLITTRSIPPKGQCCIGHPAQKYKKQDTDYPKPFAVQAGTICQASNKYRPICTRWGAKGILSEAATRESFAFRTWKPSLVHEDPFSPRGVQVSKSQLRMRQEWFQS